MCPKEVTKPWLRDILFSNLDGATSVEVARLEATKSETGYLSSTFSAEVRVRFGEEEEEELSLFSLHQDAATR